MNHFSRLGRFSLLSLAVIFSAAGCHANSNLAGMQDQSLDPAAINVAPDSIDSAQYASPSQPSYQQGPSQQEQGYGAYQSPDQSSDDPGYGQQPYAYAPEPPPPLPYYDQPYAPGEGYIWTPGYWAWSPEGYYWVPGAWVEAPYEGALWTPGYWGFWHNRYGFYRGYWGRHVGYYGGIDYGFGYIGFGYEGGYWGGGHFNYNRSVNNINTSYSHNVYERSVGGNNRGGARVSFNGGAGGVQMRARPAELSALREPHSAPMSTQVQNERSASTNRAQFANVNHGRPASVAANQPLAADRNMRAPAASPMRNQQIPQQQQRQGYPQQQQQRQGYPQQQQQRQAYPQQQQRQASPQEQQRQGFPQQQQ